MPFIDGGVVPDYLREEGRDAEEYAGEYPPKADTQPQLACPGENIHIPLGTAKDPMRGCGGPRFRFG